MSQDPMNEMPEWTEQERSLLSSAELDRPPSDSLRRTLQAASVTTAVAGTVAVASTHAAASTLAGKLTLGGALGKWLLLATCVGGAAVGVQQWREKHATSHTIAPTTQPSPRPQSAPAAPPPAGEPPAPTPATTAEDTPVAPAPRTPSARSGAPQTQPDLSRDIAALDQARQALRAGHAGEALAALDRYDAQFGKSGALRVEATVLRIEATERGGNHARAQQLAKAFLARDGKSPYAARVRAIVGQ